MGSIISYAYATTEKKLCNEIILDNETFLIKILIRCTEVVEKNIDDLLILNALQETNPWISYMHNKLIYLLYDGNKQPWNFRSNISGDIISNITANITKHCIKNNLYDPYMIEVQIIMQPYNTSLNEILKVIKNNNYMGCLTGAGSNI
jgi:hypothetical protein